MYRCLDCNYEFDEPKEYKEDLTPGGANEGGSFICKYNGCPRCSGAYEEIEEEEE